MPDYKKNQGILNGPSADDATLQGAIGGAKGFMKAAAPSPAWQALNAGAIGRPRANVTGRTFPSGLAPAPAGSAANPLQASPMPSQSFGRDAYNYTRVSPEEAARLPRVAKRRKEPHQRELFRRYASKERSPELLNLLYEDKDPEIGALYSTEEEFRADYDKWLASPRGRSYTGPNV